MNRDFMADLESPTGTQPPAPTPEGLRRAKLFWVQAGQDFRSAEKRLKAGEHLEAGYLGFQAALNALTVVCYLNGKFQLPNFSCVQMAALCAGFDQRFVAVQGACANLETVQQHGPFDADKTDLAEWGGSALKDSRQVLDAVRGYLKDHRKRAFAP